MVLKKTIDRILPETAERLPDKTALIFADRTFTYRQLEYLTNRTANGLKALGVKKGDRVTLFAQNSAEWVQSYIGIAKAGAVINPVNAMLTADELAYVVKDCGAKVLITTSERAKAVSDLRKDGSLDHVIVLSGLPPEGAISFTDLLAEQADSVEAAGNAPEELSTICYTSGTTGFPKGAMLSHESVVLSAAMTAAMNARTEHDIQFTALPLAHVYGTVVMNLSFMLGLTFVMLAFHRGVQPAQQAPLESAKLGYCTALYAAKRYRHCKKKAQRGESGYRKKRRTKCFRNVCLNGVARR
jgi:long-chain acyl-CoA synthetase